jgi:hypothetical protein
MLPTHPHTRNSPPLQNQQLMSKSHPSVPSTTPGHARIVIHNYREPRDRKAEELAATLIFALSTQLTSTETRAPHACACGAQDGPEAGHIVGLARNSKSRNSSERRYQGRT